VNTPTKLAGYTLGVAALFAAALGVGHEVGPVGPVDTAAAHQPAHSVAEHSAETGEADTETGTGGHGAHSSGPAAAETTGGLMVSQHGYTLALDEHELPPGAAIPVTFRLVGPDGAAVVDYEQTHDKALHLIAVRRDMIGFQHVHPVLGGDGTWRTALHLSAGQWRVFADFAPTGHGEAITLGADLAVAGRYLPQPLPAPAATAEVDGYTVTLDGTLRPGQQSKLTLSVSKEGKPVTDLQPYLAAYGHLVALRDGDLAYLHVHPAGEPGDGVTEPGPEITFYATAPSAGDYRLFLDFRHGGVVRTAEFTARAEEHGH